MWNRASERIRSFIRRISIIITTIDKKILFTLQLGENNRAMDGVPIKKIYVVRPENQILYWNCGLEGIFHRATH